MKETKHQHSHCCTAGELLCMSKSAALLLAEAAGSTLAAWRRLHHPSERLVQRLS
jgi:hypothetical protein